MSLSQLKERLNKEMEGLAQGPNLPIVMEPGFADKRLYAIYLTETYHYTLHNARNQALVGTRADKMDVRYMKFCFKHALEETGHELMALHDLRNLGYDVTENSLPRPLNATQALIGYLYHVSEKANPVARLGYSFWAERSYSYIRPLLALISEGLGIEKKSMTFFNEHSEIDEQHAEDVDKAIESFAKSEEDFQSIEDVMVTSLKLTANMLDEVFEEFKLLKSGKVTRYHFL